MLTAEEQEAIDGLCKKYKGHLSLQQISEGIHACIFNAAEILDDGVALLESARYPRAMSTFIAAMEEIGKVSVLSAMSRIPNNNQGLWADYWQDFRSHENKATRAFIDTYDDELRKHPDLMAHVAGWQYYLSPVGDRLRQSGYYVDFHGREQRWITPSEITESDARSWLDRVVLALSRIQHGWELGLFSVEALRVQQEVYGPLNSGRPRRKKSTLADIEEMNCKSMNSHAEYWRRLVSQGIISPESDLEVMGVPLKDFVKPE